MQQKIVYSCSVSPCDLVLFLGENETPLFLVSFRMTSWDMHTLCNQSPVCLHLMQCRRVATGRPVLAYFAYTWLYLMWRNSINLKRKTLRRSGPAVGGTVFLMSLLSLFLSYFFFILNKLTSFFTSSTRPSRAMWEIQNGARMSVSFSNCPLILNIWLYREEGDPVNGTPCLPCQHHENSPPQGEQGGMCVF